MSPEEEVSAPSEGEVCMAKRTMAGRRDGGCLGWKTASNSEAGDEFLKGRVQGRRIGCFKTMTPSGFPFFRFIAGGVWFHLYCGSPSCAIRCDKSF